MYTPRARALTTNECSFSVNYDKTVFYTDSRSPSGGSRAPRLRMGLRTGSAVRCAASDSSERQHSDSRAVGRALRQRREREREQGWESRIPATRSERDDGDGDGDSAVWRSSSPSALRRPSLWPPSPSPRRSGGLLLRGGGGGSRCGRGGGGGFFFGVGALDFVVGEPAAAALFLLPAAAGRGDRGGGAFLPPPPALDEAAEDETEPARFASARAYGDSTAPTAAAAAAGGLFEPEDDLDSSLNEPDAPLPFRRTAALLQLLIALLTISEVFGCVGFAFGFLTTPPPPPTAVAFGFRRGGGVVGAGASDATADEGRRYIPYRTHESPADVVATPVLRFNLVNFQFYKSFGAIVTLSIDGHDNVPSSTARVARLTGCGSATGEEKETSSPIDRILPEE
ncbi:hypothetical protein EVAR_66795_1 [Eumeta japonica]|uniref:Uncharacterized protein n=1 Tax=Eumeta variegata TaxID=151549 RepID=A0A4C1ZZI8_EUMVA|nr:hypothetical protein EVAR_66795_1 [Eumeta japonica]